MAGGESGTDQYFRNFISLYSNIGDSVMVMVVNLRQVRETGHVSISSVCVCSFVFSFNLLYFSVFSSACSSFL